MPSEDDLKIPVIKSRLKIEFLKLHPDFLGVNELTTPLPVCPVVTLTGCQQLLLKLSIGLTLNLAVALISVPPGLHSSVMLHWMVMLLCFLSCFLPPDWPRTFLQLFLCKLLIELTSNYLRDTFIGVLLGLIDFWSCSAESQLSWFLPSDWSSSFQPFLPNNWSDLLQTW